MNKKIISALLLLTASSQCSGMMAARFALRGLLIRTGTAVALVGGTYAACLKDQKAKQEIKKDLQTCSEEQKTVSEAAAAAIQAGMLRPNDPQIPASLWKKYEPIQKLADEGAVKKVGSVGRLLHRNSTYELIGYNPETMELEKVYLQPTRFPWTGPKIKRWVKDPAQKRRNAFNERRQEKKEDRLAKRQDRKEDKRAEQAFKKREKEYIKSQKRNQGGAGTATLTAGGNTLGQNDGSDDSTSKERVANDSE